MTKANKKTTVEKINRISEGLRYCAHCASEGAPCENCPIYEECRSLVAKLALEAIEKLMREREEREDLLDAAFSAIAELQAQQPKWIPVTERLPKPFVTVLVTHKQENGTLYKHMAHLNPQGRWAGLSFEGEVTAWMPLPEFYKAKED